MFGCFHSATKGCIGSTVLSGDNTTATWAFFSWTAFSKNYWGFSWPTSLAISFFVVSFFTLIKEKTSATSKVLMVASKSVM